METGARNGHEITTFWLSGQILENSGGFTAASDFIQMNVILCVLGGIYGDERLHLALNTTIVAGRGAMGRGGYRKSAHEPSDAPWSTPGDAPAPDKPIDMRTTLQFALHAELCSSKRLERRP